MEIDPQMIAAQTILFNRRAVQTLVLSAWHLDNIRNRPVPGPSAPSILAIRLDLSPITKQIGTPRVIFDTFNRFLELPCTAVRGKDLEIE